MIRKIQKQDREAFMQLSETFYNSNAVLYPIPQDYRENTFRELMRSQEYAECYLFMENDRAVGYALTAKTYSQEAGGMVLWIEELFVLPEYRSKGLAKKFFVLVEEEARANGYARIRLEVEEENERARALYEQLGYSPLGYGQMRKELKE